MVQLFLNNQECDLYGNETIATDYSIAPISNISTRGSAKSITFKIPLTANNRAIIENANVIVNATTLPYTFVPAKLKANGLTQQIEFAQIKSVKDDIEIVLFGSNVDFYGIIKSRKLEDLGAVWLHVWNINLVANTHNATSGYIYPMIDYNADDFMDPSAIEIDVRGMLPGVFLYSVILEIISQTGYTAQGDFLTDANYRTVVLAGIGTNIGAVKPRMLSVATISAPVTISSSTFIEFDTATYDPLGLIEDAPGWAWVYRAYLTGEYSIRVTLNVTFNAVGFTLAVDKRISPGMSTFVMDSEFITGTGTFVLEFSNLNLAIDDELYFIGVGTSAVISSATLEIIDTTTTDTIFGKEIDPSANIGDMKQSDLLKDTAQKFGLIYSVDNVRKIVHIRRFSEIVDNIGNALDWSDKVDYSEKAHLEFNSDYAQRNKCTYKEDETVRKPIGTDSYILIANQNLEAEADLFESPFAASEQVERFNGLSIAQIKIFTALGTADQEQDEVEPRYLVIRMHTFSIFTYTNGTGTLTTTDVPLTHFILPGEEFNVGYGNNLLDYSEDLIALVQEYKLVKVLLRLTPADINQLDFFKPVWIQIVGQSGCYFYISKVSQFKVTENESTEVELIKLNV